MLFIFILTENMFGLKQALFNVIQAMRLVNVEFRTIKQKKKKQ